jgi:DNA-binding NarL/FixJ family response regulator
MLEEQPDLKVVGEANDGIELLNLLQIKEPFPQMVILDITMPNLGGIDATRKIKATYPSLKILILTVHKEREYLRQAISAGAEGYLLKEDMGTDLFSAIKTIQRGGGYISGFFSKRNGQ